MQKVLKLLEQYVQWIALALGVGFLGWMIWFYIVHNPAERSIPIGGTEEIVTPGKIDEVINDGPASDLERKSRGANPGFRITVPSPAPVDLDTNPLGAATAAPDGLWDSWIYDLRKGIKSVSNANGGVVQALPTLPPVTFMDQEPLRTVLLVSNAAGQQDHLDNDSVTTFWQLPVKDLADAFDKAFKGKLTPNQQSTLFVRADLIRQQEIGDNQWGPEEVVARPFDPAAPPFPQANAPAAVVQAYQNWLAAPNAEFPLMASPFPMTEQFQNRPELQWYPLDGLIQARAAAAQAAAQAAQQLAQQQQQALQQQQANQNPQGNVQVFGGGQGPNGLVPAVQQVITAPPPPPPTVNTPPGQGTGGNPAPAPNQPQGPALQAPPSASFIPSNLFAAGANGNIGVWFTDLTVEPGKTYRYKVVYSLSNPIFGQPQRAAAPALAANYGMDSEASDWSAPVDVPARTQFWCAPKQNFAVAQHGGVRFSVYTWHEGMWYEKDYDVDPGGEVGADEGAQGNYLTHFTLLDVKTDSNGKRVAFLISDDGQETQQRDVAGDMNTPEAKAFIAMYQAQQAQLLQQQGGQPTGPGQGPGPGITQPGLPPPPPNQPPGGRGDR
ncbi:MAG TPA: hypothetical protein VL992_07100 [Tepidisphaeraceae bacterium]|nr:hypothetical protein [Tepidisphaeraceae bacterium]